MTSYQFGQKKKNRIGICRLPDQPMHALGGQKSIQKCSLDKPIEHWCVGSLSVPSSGSNSHICPSHQCRLKRQWEEGGQENKFFFFFHVLNFELNHIHYQYQYRWPALSWFSGYTIRAIFFYGGYNMSRLYCGENAIYITVAGLEEYTTSVLL